MSPSPLVTGENDQSNDPLPVSSPSMESIGQNSPDLIEFNYMGFSHCSSGDSFRVSKIGNNCKSKLNLKATELRLGLPGSVSPERDDEICLLKEKPLFPLRPSNDNQFSGNKRGFSDAMNGFKQEKFAANSDQLLSPRPSSNMVLKGSLGPDKLGSQPATVKEMSITEVTQDKTLATQERQPTNTTVHNVSSAPAPKAQVVGWPPIRSFRKNSFVTTLKNAEPVETKAVGKLFVKVSMDGAPYLRKVDLGNYCTYQELSSSLEKMFSCFTLGQHESQDQEVVSQRKMKDLLGGSEYVLTYEDKDGDWMLVGDVPWDMFAETCRRLRIMKSSDAIGLAPRGAMEKSKKGKRVRGGDYASGYDSEWYYKLCVW